MDTELLQELQQTIGMNLSALTISFMTDKDWVFLLQQACGTADSFAVQEDRAGCRQSLLEVLGFALRAIQDHDQKEKAFSQCPSTVVQQEVLT